MARSLEWVSTRLVQVGDEQYDVSELVIDGIEFEVSVLAVRPSTPQRFSLQKSRSMVERYVDLVETLPAHRVVELGVFQGGSTAMIALMPTTEKVMAVDINDLSQSALAEFICQRGLDDRVLLLGETDQADGARIERGLARAGLDELDLVVDDASHRYAQTVASFEIFFPRLRSGGVYVIEDWRWAHVRGIGLGDYAKPRGETPLTRLVFELTMACGTDSGVVAEVDVSHDFITVRRGPADVDPQRFRVAGSYDDISADLLGDW